MIISSKTSRSTSNVRRSEALVSRRGFLKRLTAGGVMLAARTVSLWGIVGLAMAATTTGCGSEVGFSLASPASDGLTLGTWGPILQLETHPMLMAVLPSGKVLMLPWAPERFDPPHGPVALWDPATGGSLTYPGSGIESGGTRLSAGWDSADGRRKHPRGRI
ncbi:MAG: twin-arginine translocation signal domain-containing protein [Planctomycetota bacterium]|jgi:hypothetical protein